MSLKFWNAETNMYYVLRLPENTIQMVGNRRDTFTGKTLYISVTEINDKLNVRLGRDGGLPSTTINESFPEANPEPELTFWDVYREGKEGLDPLLDDD